MAVSTYTCPKRAIQQVETRRWVVWLRPGGERVAAARDAAETRIQAEGRGEEHGERGGEGEAEGARPGECGCEELDRVTAVRGAVESVACRPRAHEAAEEACARGGRRERRSRREEGA